MLKKSFQNQFTGIEKKKKKKTAFVVKRVARQKHQNLFNSSMLWNKKNLTPRKVPVTNKQQPACIG